MMNLRQTLEAGACAAFAIANPDHAHFVDTDEHGILDPSPKLVGKRYDWIDKNYPDGSTAIKEMKQKINASVAHANLINTHNTFRTDYEAGWFAAPFFDIEDEHYVKTDLWLIGNVALTLMHYFYEINEGRNVIKFVDNFWPLIQTLGQRNEERRWSQLTSSSGLWRKRLRERNQLAFDAVRPRPQCRNRKVSRPRKQAGFEPFPRK